MAVWTDDFARDGALRDIYVLGTTVHDWSAFLRIVAGRNPKLTREGVEVPLPAEAAGLFHTNHVLHFFIGPIDFSCHFFHHQDIEVSFDPVAIDAQTIHDLLAFVTELCDVLRKTVVVTPENLIEDPIYRCEPDGRGPIYNAPR